MIDQNRRREYFNMACDLLGGQRAVARILKVSDRTVRNLCAGTHDIKIGFMRDVTTALDRRAHACVALARVTDPLFVANMTEAEAASLTRPENRRG